MALWKDILTRVFPVLISGIIRRTKDRKKIFLSIGGMGVVWDSRVVGECRQDFGKCILTEQTIRKVFIFGARRVKPANTRALDWGTLVSY